MLHRYNGPLCSLCNFLAIQRFSGSAVLKRLRGFAHITRPSFEARELL